MRLDFNKKTFRFKEPITKNGNLSSSINYINEAREKGTKTCGVDYDGEWCMFKYVYTETATTTYPIKGTNQKLLFHQARKPLNL